jgi:hypothetical protein
MRGNTANIDRAMAPDQRNMRGLANSQPAAFSPILFENV